MSSWIKSIGYDDINHILYINGKPHCKMPEELFREWSDIEYVYDWGSAFKIKEDDNE